MQQDKKLLVTSEELLALGIAGDRVSLVRLSELSGLKLPLGDDDDEIAEELLEHFVATGLRMLATREWFAENGSDERALTRTWYEAAATMTAIIEVRSTLQPGRLLYYRGEAGDWIRHLLGAHAEHEIRRKDGVGRDLDAHVDMLTESSDLSDGGVVVVGVKTLDEREMRALVAIDSNGARAYGVDGEQGEVVFEDHGLGDYVMGWLG